MQKQKPHVFIAVPAQDEMAYLPAMLNCLQNQTYAPFELVICVNQPEDWWQLESKREICESNMKCLRIIKSWTSTFKISVIDRCSPGKGWVGKKRGVGQARKVLMDFVAENANDTDILISLDADTTFHPTYLQSVVDNFVQHPGAVALSVPYFHLLTGLKEQDRAILHYEIYMRYFAINLLKIKNPYAFTAVGSAMALPLGVYRAIGGITPHQSGEDFYFIQKLRKFGSVLIWNAEKVYPAARFSDRVGFGTGPALIKGSQGNWVSYPIYPSDYFEEVKQTYDLFEECFYKDVATPMDEFIQEKFSEKSIWKKLRQNSSSPETFVQACTHKLDALRILQYLKWRHAGGMGRDEDILVEWLEKLYPEKLSERNIKLIGLSFRNSSNALLDKVRLVLVEIEEEFQMKAAAEQVNLKTHNR